MQTSGTDGSREALFVGCPLSSKAAEMAEPILGGLRSLISQLAPPSCAVYFDEQRSWPKRHQPVCSHQALLERLDQKGNAIELARIFHLRQHSPVEDCLAAMLQDLGHHGLAKGCIAVLDDGNRGNAGDVFLPPLCKFVRRMMSTSRLNIVYGGLACGEAQAECIRGSAHELGIPDQNVTVRLCIGSREARCAGIEEVIAGFYQTLKIG